MYITIEIHCKNVVLVTDTFWLVIWILVHIRTSCPMVFVARYLCRNKNIHFPLENVVLETDSPYLSPSPYRGKRNESGYVKLVAEKLATIKNRTLEEVAEITSKNALDIFEK